MAMENRKTLAFDMLWRFSPESYDSAENTVDLTWSTGARGLRNSWTRGDYYESLSMEPGAVRLERLNRGAPLLEAHDGGSNASVIGVVIEGSARIEEGTGRATVRLSTAPSAADTVHKIREGVLKNVSVGYMVHQYEIEQREDGPDEYMATDWEPYEVSIVPMPFDAAAQVRNFESITPEKPETSTKERELGSMKEQQEHNAEPAETVNVVDIEKRAAARERSRIANIRAAAAKLNIGGESVEKLIADGASEDVARAALIDLHVEANERNEPETSQHISGGGLDELDHRVGGIADALLHRCKPGKFELSERGKAYRYSSLMDIATMAAEASGQRTAGLSKQEIVARALKTRGAFATTDFADLMVSTARRILRQAYVEAPANYQMLAGRRVSPDFKATRELIFGGMGQPQEIREGGEFRHATETVEGAEWSLSTYGQKMNLTWQAIINDDLEAFARKTAQFGAAARRLENSLFYDLLLSNPVAYDGAPMFSAARGNVLSSTTTPAAADPSKDQYGFMRSILGRQTGLDANEDLELEPRYVVCGFDQATNVESLTLQTVPDTVQNAIPGAFRSYMPVVSARIDRTDGDVYFFAADPMQIESFIYAHLQGMENGPIVEEMDSWNTLGVEWRSYNCFAVACIDFRGWVINDQNSTIVP